MDINFESAIINEHMKKSIKYSFLALLLAVSFFVASTVFASEESVKSDDSSVEDLSSAGILPTNPFHFMKEFGWGFKRLIPKSALRKFELEGQIQEKAVLEIRKMISMEIDNPSAVEKSILVFKESLDNMNAVSSFLTEENLGDLSDSILRAKNNWMKLQRFVSSKKIEIDGLDSMYSNMSEILKNLGY